MRLPGFMTRLASPDPTASAGDFVPGEEGSRQIPLDELEKGQCGVVVDLELAEGDDNRLRTLGICPGRRVWLVRKGDPMVLRVMNSRLGLAQQLAKQVTVEVGAPPCSIATDLSKDDTSHGNASGDEA